LKVLLVVALSVFIHFSFYSFVQEDTIEQKITKENHKSTNSKITYVKIKAPKEKQTSIEKPKPKPKPQKKEVVKKMTPKKVVKKEIPKVEKKTTPKTTKKVIKPKPKPQKKEVVKKVVKKKLPKIDKTTQTLLDLYGKEFDNFSQETKIYLIKNIRNIASITKIFLEYPYMSVQAGQSGVSVVEFILYPNGTITDLRIIKTSNYFLLDDNTVETIEAAYSDYPRPSKPTVIRIYVKYILN